MAEGTDDVGAPPRRLGGSIAAVFAGFVAVVVLSLGTDLLVQWLCDDLPRGQEVLGTGRLLLALAYRTAYGVAGSFLAARLAPRAPIAHAMILGGIGFVLSVIGMVAMWHLGANWYPIALVVTALPGAWLGGVLARRMK